MTLQPDKMTSPTSTSDTNLIKMSRAYLMNLCEQQHITKYKDKNKTQLVELIRHSETILNNTSHTSISADIESTHLKPFIKWNGGKGDEIKLFEEYFPAQFTRYIEPFVGGGSVYFYLNHDNSVISDVHTELIDLYKSIGNGNGGEIYEFMKNTPNDESTYYKIRDEMSVNNELENAQRFYYQRKTCFRGMLRYNKNGRFNIPYGKYKSVNFKDLTNKAYEKLLSKTEILNQGFERLFELYNDETNFMFLDPPYDSEFTDYGYCQFGKKEHQQLASLFKSTKNKCLLIIGKTPFIEQLYQGYIVGEYDKKYKFKFYNNRVGTEINTKHLIIKNY